MKDLLTFVAAWLACMLAVRMLDAMEANRAMFAIDDEYEALVEEQA